MSIKAPIVGVKKHPTIPGRFLVKYRVSSFADFTHYFNNEMDKGFVSFRVSNPPPVKTAVDVMIEIARTRVLNLNGFVSQVNQVSPKTFNVIADVGKLDRKWKRRIEMLMKDGNVNRHFQECGSELMQNDTSALQPMEFMRAEEVTLAPMSRQDAEAISFATDQATAPSAIGLERMETIDKMFRRGRLLLAQRRIKSARIAFSEVLQMGGSEADHFAYYAWSLFQEGESDQKLIQESVNRALAKDPTNELANLIEGYFSKAAGDFRKAIHHFKSALAANPNSPAKKELDQLQKTSVR